MSTSEPGTFANLVQDALLAAVTPEKVEAKVQQHVDKMVAEAIADAMHAWSGTGKAVKAAIEESLRVNKLDLPSYGHVVAQLLERQIQAAVSEVVAAKLAKDMADLLTLAPKRVKLSALVAELLGKEDDPCHCDGPGEVYCKVEWSEYGWVQIYLSEDKPTQWRDADVQLTVYLPKKQAAYERDEVIEGPISTGRLKGSDLKKDVRFGYGTDYAKQGVQFGRWFGFEQKILAMYACGTVIEIDDDEVVTSRGDF